MNVNASRGLSLVEMLTVLAVVSAIGLSVPSLADLLARQQLINSQSELRILVSRARQDALYYRARVTLCALNNEGQCHRQWGNQITAFFDPNGNRTLDPDEQVISQIGLRSNIMLTWRGMKPADSIHFNAMGHTFVSNGTFSLCHPAYPQTMSLVINRQGRTRTEKAVKSCEKKPTA